jgi:rhizosphere induced protein
MKRKKRNFPVCLVLFSLSLLLLLPISAITGCSNDGNSIDEDQKSTEINNLDGGILAFGQVHINFPPGSIEDTVSVSGKIVLEEDIPGHITPLSGVHRISLSDPEQYRARTASLKFTLSESIDGANIYHSKDGKNWENLAGNIGGNTISTKINSFSSFFVGNVSESASTTYEVVFVNNSTLSGNVCIFQTAVGSQLSTVWLGRYSYPDTQTTFKWSIDYAFTWAQTGPLMPGKQFMASQIVETSLTSDNKITIDYTDGAFAFTSKTLGPQPELLYVEQSANIPLNTASIGMAMSGSTVYVAQAAPNLVTAFNPVGSKGFIFFGDYEMGEVLDPEQISNKEELSFPESGYYLKAILNADHSWTIETE